MPGRDGTGPIGFGRETENGFGFCSGARKGKKRGGTFFGRQCGLGFGRTGLVDSCGADERELLAARKKSLEDRLNAINERLNSMEIKT